MSKCVLAFVPGMQVFHVWNGKYMRYVNVYGCMFWFACPWQCLQGVIFVEAFHIAHKVLYGHQWHQIIAPVP